MAKINLDKYYTDPTIVGFCLAELAKLNLPITEYLEPSAGAGAFSLKLPEGSLAYDIEPEHESIVKQDFLSLELAYKEGRCVIGNPPFGEHNKLSLKFFEKAVELADYVAFIQPISQLDNTNSLYKFDLVLSVRLPVVSYSGVKLLCCFNVYKRPEGNLNTKPVWRMNDLTITRVCRGEPNRVNGVPSYGINGWGDLTKKPKFQGEYSCEYWFIIHNKTLETKVISLLESTDFNTLVDNISSKKLQIWRLYKYLKEQIPELN